MKSPPSPLCAVRFWVGKIGFERSTNMTAHSQVGWTIHTFVTGNNYATDFFLLHLRLYST